MSLIVTGASSGIGAALVSAPLRAPILLTDGGGLPAVTSETLDRLKPKGAQLASGAQAILIGDKPGPPKGLRPARIRGSDPNAVAVAIDKFSSVARGKPSGDVVVASGEKPEYAVPDHNYYIDGCQCYGASVGAAAQ